MALTQAEKDLVALEIVKEVLIGPFYKKYKETLETVVNERGLNKPYQHRGIGVLLTEKKGQWTDFTPFEAKTTKITPKDKFDFTLKAAKEAGLDIVVPENLQKQIPELQDLLGEIAYQSLTDDA